MKLSRDHIVVLCFIACIALPLPLDRALAALGVALPGNLLSREAGVVEVPSDFLDGSAGQKIEGSLRNGSYLARGASAHYNAWTLRWFRRAPPATWLGDDDWLFVPARTRDLRAAGWARERREAHAAISEVAERLEAQGIELLVAIIPDRARIYPDKAYHAGELPPGKRAFLGTLIGDLEHSGIAVVDVSATLAAARQAGEKVFYRTDHHWTSSGAKHAAATIAAALRRLPDFAAPDGQELIPVRYEPGRRHSLARNLGLSKRSPLQVDYWDQAPLARSPARPAIRWSQACATYWSSSYGTLAPRSSLPTRSVARCAPAS